MAAFVFKVFTLTIRTISKPLAGRVQQMVLNHPRLQKPVIRLAQVMAPQCSALTGNRLHFYAKGAVRQGCQAEPHNPVHGQWLHRAEVAINRGAEGKTGKVFVADISEEKAMELAGKFVSESFVWAVSPAPRS